jgi:hypothetical protein
MEFASEPNKKLLAQLTLQAQELAETTQKAVEGSIATESDFGELYAKLKTSITEVLRAERWEPKQIMDATLAIEVCRTNLQLLDGTNTIQVTSKGSSRLHDIFTSSANAA